MCDLFSLPFFIVRFHSFSTLSALKYFSILVTAVHDIPSLHTHSGIQTTLSTFIYFYYFRLTIPPHPFVTHPQLHTAPINHP